MASLVLVCASVACGGVLPSASASASATVVPTAPPGTPPAEPGRAWASFIRDDCEWSGPETPPAVCFGNRGAGFQVRAIRRDGERWYVWDPSTNNFAYVDRAALSLPAALTADAPPTPDAAKTVVACVDRSSGYRYTGTAKAALGAWMLNNAHPGDVFYLRWIEEDSYRPEAEAVPAVRVPPDPTPVSLAVATPGPPNPFDVVQVAQATATVRAIEDVETSATATEQAARQANLEAISRGIGAFLALQPAAAASADVGGCVRKASELLAGSADDRYLIVASSAGGGAPALPGLALDRAQLRLVYFQCDNADQCDRAKQSWSELATAANAANVRFSDPSQGLGHIEL